MTSIPSRPPSRLQISRSRCRRRRRTVSLLSLRPRSTLPKTANLLPLKPLPSILPRPPRLLPVPSLLLRNSSSSSRHNPMPPSRATTRLSRRSERLRLSRASTVEATTLAHTIPRTRRACLIGVGWTLEAMDRCWRERELMEGLWRVCRSLTRCLVVGERCRRVQ